MCEFILPDSAPARKTIGLRLPDLALPPICADLICPRCHHEASLSSSASCVWCPTCGWVHGLVVEERDSLEDALMGISDLNAPTYLLLLASQDGPTPVVAGGVAA